MKKALLSLVLCYMMLFNTACSNFSTIGSIAQVIVDAAGVAFTIAEPGSAALVTGIEKAFAAIVGAANAANKNASAGNLAALNAAIQSADANVADLEVAVKNPNTAGEIKAFVDVAANTLAQIVADLPAPPASANMAAAPVITLRSHGTVPGWKHASDVKKALKKIDPRFVK